MSGQYLCHWMEGGDGVTNFDPADCYIYARAIEEHGDASFYIGPPMPQGLPADRALRVRGLTRCGRDLSDFWDVFDHVKAAATAPKAQGAAS